MTDLDALFRRRTFGIRPGIEAISAAWEAMGRPCATLPAVHVVGTNGKGSVSAMAAHALTRRGHAVGLYTSPHLHRTTERVRVRGAEVETHVLAAAVDRVIALEGEVPGRALSFFEVLTLAALDVFARAGLDAIVVEAGLGGRLDATRLVSPRAVAVTSIAMDHEKWLGSTLGAIAGEKAGVFVPGVPVFTGAQHPEAMAALREHAERVGCELHVCAPLDHAPLHGAFQQGNAAIALACARVIDPAVDAIDFRGVSWPGRLERIKFGKGELVLDVAHNPAAVEAIVEALRSWDVRDTVVLFACSADKDRARMIASLRSLGGELWTLADADADLVAAEGADREFASLRDPSLRDALRRRVSAGARMLVCGSHRLVGGLFAAAADPSDPR